MTTDRGAICPHCNRGMLSSNGCSLSIYHFDNGTVHRRLVHDGESACHDCGAQPGHYHHPGCDMEDCPQCGHQFISCGCGVTGPLRDAKIPSVVMIGLIQASLDVDEQAAESTLRKAFWHEDDDEF